MAMRRLYMRTSFDLVHAVREGDQDTILELIDENPRWDEGCYLLCEAIERDLEIAKLLIKHGANVNSRSRAIRTTALTLAVKTRDEELVKILIEKGAVVNRKNLDNSTALHYASKLNTLDIALLLIRCGADVNARNDCNETPLALAVMHNNTSMIDILVQYGADLSVKSESGSAPLHTAVQSCPLDTIKCLLTKNVDLHARNDYNRDPLYLSILRADKEIVRHLIEAGASPHTYYHHVDGVKMPLHVACHYSRSPIVEVLLSKGANVHALSEHKVYIPAGCITNYSVKESNMTPLHCAAYRGNQKICKKLLKHGAKVNARTAHGFTALHLATARGNNMVMRTLVRAGADTNAATDTGLTSLHLAAREGAPNTIKILLDGHANVNARDINGLTPLHLAAEKGKVENVKFILNHSPDINAVDSNGNTALHFAVEWEPIVLALIEHCCDVNIENVHCDAPIRYVLLKDRLCVSVKKYCLQKSDPYRFESAYTDLSYKTFDPHTTIRVHQYLRKVFVSGVQMADSNINNLRLLASHQTGGQWNSFGNYCKEELEKMKITEINKTHVTFHDILTKPPEKLFPLLRNENIVDAIAKHNLHRQFPVHEHLIKARFDKAMIRLKLSDESAKFFCASLIPDLRKDLPNHCVENIFSHLRNEDLSNLKDVFETACTDDVEGTEEDL